MTLRKGSIALGCPFARRTSSQRSTCNRLGKDSRTKMQPGFGGGISSSPHSLLNKPSLWPPFPPMHNEACVRWFLKLHLSLWASENKKELSNYPLPVLVPAPSPPPPGKLNINLQHSKPTLTRPSPSAAPCFLWLENAQRCSLCFPFYDLNLIESREREENVSLFSGPSLCLHVLSCKMRITTIITIRKYLSPRNMGKVHVHEIMGPVLPERGRKGSRPHPGVGVGVGAVTLSGSEGIDLGAQVRPRGEHQECGITRGPFLYLQGLGPPSFPACWKMPSQRSQAPAWTHPSQYYCTWHLFGTIDNILEDTL